MKKLLFLCLLAIVFGSKPSAAYEYVPLVREGVEWGYAYENPDNISGELTYYRLQFRGTTEINGKIYHNLLKYYGYTRYNSEIVAYMREEDKKVYVTFSDDSSEEYLRFDFGLKEGDKFQGSEISHARTCIETGFVNTATGPRRYMKFSSDVYEPEYDMLIEGIGPYKSTPETYYYGGSIIKPIYDISACHPKCDKFDILLYERKVNTYIEQKGEMIWTNPVCFEAIGKYDPSVWHWNNLEILGAVENTLTEGTDVEITVENNAVNVNSSTTDILYVETYDIEGRLLSTMKPVNNRCSVSLSSISGMAIVKVTTTTGIYSTKVASK